MTAITMLARRLCLPALAICVLGAAAAARAQVDVLYGVSSSITDLSLNPPASNQNPSGSHVGAAQVLLPISLAVNDAYGGGTTSTSAVGQMGVMHCFSQAGFAYVIRTSVAGGSASTGSHFDIDDYLTVTSATLPVGTAVSINVSLLLSGSVSVPAAGQARPGITANNNAYMRATSSIDDKLLSESNPATPVHDLTAVLQARVGDEITLRYGIQTLALLSSDIADYRSVSCDYSGLAVVTAQDPAVVLTSGSGYAYSNCTNATVSSQPAPQTVCGGGPATFSVTPAGTGPFTYHWRKNTVPMDTNAIPSAALATLSLASTSAGDAGLYDCVVTNSCGNATSNAAKLTVHTSCCTPNWVTDNGCLGPVDLLQFLSLYFTDYDGHGSAVPGDNLTIPDQNPTGSIYATPCTPTAAGVYPVVTAAGLKADFDHDCQIGPTDLLGFLNAYFNPTGDCFSGCALLLESGPSEGRQRIEAPRQKSR